MPVLVGDESAPLFGNAIRLGKRYSHQIKLAVGNK
jgi:hypothetical protein